MSGLGIDKTRPRNARSRRAFDSSTDAGFWMGIASGAAVWWSTGSSSLAIACALCSVVIGLSLGYRNFRRANRPLAASR